MIMKLYNLWPQTIKVLLRYIRCWLQVLPVCTGEEDFNTAACLQHLYPISLSALCHLCNLFDLPQSINTC